jgi:4'-phosphopantetheinyl transferase
MASEVRVTVHQPMLVEHLTHPPALALDEIHVWVTRVEEVDPGPAVLSPAEHKRISGYADPRDGTAFRKRRVLLRRLLGSYLDLDPAGLRFSTRCVLCGDSDHGKPYLMTPAPKAIRFSASCSWGWILIAISGASEVGADIERLDRTLPARQLTPLVLSDREQEPDPAASGAEQVERFFTIWTLKEAFLKASGHGLGRSHGLDSLTIRWSGAQPTHLYDEGPEPTARPGWQLNSARVGPCFLAVAGPEGHRVRWLRPRRALSPSRSEDR